jgi:hypothetical protein
LTRSKDCRPFPRLPFVDPAHRLSDRRRAGPDFRAERPPAV